MTNDCLVVYNTYMPLSIVAEQSDPPTTECSAVGSALDLGSRGRGFEPPPFRLRVSAPNWLKAPGCKPGTLETLQVRILPGSQGIPALIRRRIE